MRVLTLLFVAAGGVLALVGSLQMSGLALFGALGTSIASAARCPRRVLSWAPSAVIIVAMATVVLADLLGAPRR